MIYVLQLSPIRKVKNKEMPLSLEVAKGHKVMIIHSLKLVVLCAFVSLWLNHNFRR